MRHEELRTRFWLLVFVFNVGPIAFFFGLLLLLFEGDSRGYAAMAVGIVATFAGLRMYRRTRVRIEEEVLGDEPERP